MILFRRKSVAIRRFNSMPLPMLKLNESTMENHVHLGHHSTPQAMDIESANMAVSPNSSTASDGSSISQTGDISGSSSGSSAMSSCEAKRASFYMEESCSQDSGLGADRADSTDSKDLVSTVVVFVNLKKNTHTHIFSTYRNHFMTKPTA